MIRNRKEQGVFGTLFRNVNNEGDVGSGGSDSTVPLNIKSFGAKGDDSADDTQAFINAFDISRTYPSSFITIIVPPGTYRITGPISIPKNTVFQGAGGVIKPIFNTDSTKYESDGSQTLFKVNEDDVSVKDFIFDGSAFIDSVKKPGFQLFKGNGDRAAYLNNKFFNIPKPDHLDTSVQRYHALVLDHSSATITGNYVDGGGGDLINCNTGYFFVSGNYIKNSGDGGIAFNNNATGIISGNKIVRCNLGIGSGPMGKTTDVDKIQNGIIIKGNEITNCAIGINMGWFAYSGRNGPTSITISGNVIKGCCTGIEYDGNNNGEIMHNVSLNITGNNILSLGQDHEFWKCKQDGKPTDIGAGIWFLAAGGGVISSNIITGCYGASFPAIRVDGNNILINGNMIQGNEGGNNFSVGISGPQLDNTSIVSNNIITGANNDSNVGNAVGQFNNQTPPLSKSLNSKKGLLLVLFLTLGLIILFFIAIIIWKKKFTF